MNYDMATARLIGFRSETRWALLFEELVSWPAAEGMMSIIFAFGPGSSRGQGFINLEHACPLTLCDRDQITLNEQYQEVIPPQRALILRGEALVVDSQQIQRHGRESDFDLLVHLLPEYREKLLATDQELRLYVQDDLQTVIQLDNWHHPDVYGWNQTADRSIVPSDTKSMQMIAQVLVTGNSALYQPCEEPNVDWRLWFEK